MFTCSHNSLFLLCYTVLVFTVSEGELAMMIRHGVLKRNGGEPDSRFVSNYVVRLRGLPYSANVEDVKEFFKGLKIPEDFNYNLLLCHSSP